MNTSVNQIGLEAEFLLRDKDGNLVYPTDHGFSADEFALLGEFRADPSASRAGTIANFMKVYYETLYKAKALKLTIDIGGWAKVSPTLYAQILRRMGSKSVAACRNIHGTDILTLSDAETEGGKVLFQRVSAGLHIHFSAESVTKETVKSTTYQPVKLPLSVNGAQASFDLYRADGDTTREIVARANRITAPVVESFVCKLDADMLPRFVVGMPPLKYRNPGFYEMKGYGFEYRSLPFSEDVLKKIDEVVDYSFNLLESL